MLNFIIGSIVASLFFFVLSAMAGVVVTPLLIPAGGLIVAFLAK